jgi:hypothetical protein
MSRRVSPRAAWHAARFAALVAATLLAAHDAIYVLRFGLGDAYAAGMAATGHSYWDAFTAWGLGSGSVLLVTALITLGRLRRRALSTLDDRADVAGYAAELSRLWPRLLVAVGVAFVVQEGVEHAIFFGHLPTIEELAGILGPSSLAGLGIVTFLVAAVGSAVRWRVSVLRARIRASGARRHVRSVHASAPSRWPITAALRRHAFLLLRLDAGRAPPLAGAT